MERGEGTKSWRTIVRTRDWCVCMSRRPIRRVVDRGTRHALGSGMAGLVLCGKFPFLARLIWHEFFLPTFPVFEFFIDGVVVAVGVQPRHARCERLQEGLTRRRRR